MAILKLNFKTYRGKSGNSIYFYVTVDLFEKKYRNVPGVVLCKSYEF